MFLYGCGREEGAGEAMDRSRLESLGEYESLQALVQKHCVENKENQQIDQVVNIMQENILGNVALYKGMITNLVALYSKQTDQS